MGKKVKIILLGLAILVIIVIGFAIFGESEIEGELYPTSTQGLEVVKASEIIELKDGDKIDLSIDIIKKEIAGKEIKMFGYNGQILVLFFYFHCYSYNLSLVLLLYFLIAGFHHCQ